MVHRQCRVELWTSSFTSIRSQCIGCQFEAGNRHCSLVLYSHENTLLHHLLKSTSIGCSTQTGQHERCKRECCPVWVLQYICWISIGKWHV